MTVFRLGDQVPQIDADSYVAPNAAVIGRVRLLAGASVWFGATVRGDNEEILIGCDSNVQDGAVLHTDPGKPLTIGSGVTIGHQAMLHGCEVGDGSLIGIQAIVLNGARLGRECLVAAGALISEGKSFPDGVLIMGIPGRVARTLDAAERAALRRSAENYAQRQRLYRTQLQALTGLAGSAPAGDGG